ncbi:class I SAM-dependent methyltransferase [Bradyrhizobium sp. SZCCHNS3052]|uniref:class I SAM-dependent methyltransferase n=1 Tax=unclassified Bradyrhizobium TaxID=2631580 RepID=UPI00291666DF|nr:class I SAM-dependent methyltransferase [Bradyrhizobium sp. SZCCHNS3052]
MLSTQLGLRPVTNAPVPCKICDGPASLYGVVDMNRPCQTAHAHRPPLAGVPIYYRRCADCGFLFTDAFDDWSIEQFKTHIYNDGYEAVDPDYRIKRPTDNAAAVARFWAPHKAGMRVLDFGGGNDLFCTGLRAQGFAEAVTYDPMVAEHATQPDRKFDLVTCFETLEHVPDPLATIGAMAACVAEPGAVFYSTLTQPDDFESQGMSWWYIAPRNGHISIYTQHALALAWHRFSFKTAPLNAGTHLAFRTLPPEWGLAEAPTAA